MASLHLDERSNNWIVMFRYGAKQFRLSCRTTNESEAKGVKATIEGTLQLLNTGRLLVPPDTKDVGLWIMSGGKVAEKPRIEPSKKSRLDDVCTDYLKDQVDKADTTLVGERVHVGHLRRHLGDGTELRSIDLGALQRFVAARLRETRAGRPVSGKTIKKELTTFIQVWEWARHRKLVEGSCPVKDPSRPQKWAVAVPKASQSEKFMTFSDVERRIARGGLSDGQAKDLWRFVFLDEAQVGELLEHVRTTARHPFVHPMFAIAAFTGARRSEICRSLIDDVQLDERLVLLRERKRRKDMAGTTREVPLHPKLKEIFKAWFSVHPGGQYTITLPLAVPRRKAKTAFDEMSRDEAHHHFKQALAGGKWAVLPGFHVLRHSFGAICTRAGIPMNVIAKWMGHSTEEMMKLYQHLFPQDERQWMEKLPLGGPKTGVTKAKTRRGASQ
jgi:integrase